MMQRLVGIVRIEEEMQQAVNGIAELWKRARNVSVTGNREYNAGWHTALDLPNLLTVAEAITHSALRRKESRGAHFREDYSTKDAALGKMNLVVSKRTDGTMSIDQRPVAAMPGELQQIIEEMK
jgi:succinate dehydrogenase / fumarate reductase flavoprotein subunit